MPRVKGRFSIYKRKDTGKYTMSLSTASGLPARVCKEWDRVGFNRLPPELAHLRNPKSENAAKNTVDLLIVYLKKQVSLGILRLQYDDIYVGEWLERFTTLENNPRSARLISEGTPYSIDTIEGYRQKYSQYLKNDQFMQIKMAAVEERDALEFNGRLGLMLNKRGEPIAGTRTFEIVSRFVRMAFHVYEEENHGWLNPFRYIKAPKSKNPLKRGALTDEELISLFNPMVFSDPLQKAICAAIFTAGLRRSEVFALKPENLDWHAPKINVTNAWKSFSSKKKRVIGDPKWHKIRETLFPDQLQMAIKELWEKYGKHKSVFCYKDGTTPGPGYLKYWVPRWFKKAGINTEGRNIVPHAARNSLASVLENDGVPLRYIQKLLGHSKMETTIGYLNEPANTINKITKKINQKI